MALESAIGLAVQTENLSSKSAEGGSWRLPRARWIRSLAFGLPLLAVLIQIQATFSLVGTDVRLNTADLALMLASPLLLAGGLYWIRDLYKASGWPLLAALAAASVVMTVSLLIGHAAIGEFTG